MKHRFSAFYVCMALLILLAACAPQTSAQTSATPSLVPVNLAGPEMKEGSTFQYVDGSLLVAVPAGPFTMGAGGLDNPQHTVTLSDFWIYSTKVTNQQFGTCVQAGGCTAPDKNDDPVFADPGRANDPVIGVTYDQASAYCAFVHGRLPTEAEWEKTARGPDANIYPWGNAAPTCDLLNFNKCVGKTTNVVTYPQGQSYYHALDMEGNAFEWVADRYSPTYYKESPAQDPPGPDTGQYRSVRASSFASAADRIPAATRAFDLPANHRNDLGFRCVVEDPTYFAPYCQTVVVTGLSGPPAPVGSCPKPYIHSEPVCLPGDVPGEIVTFGPAPAPAGSGLSGTALADCAFASVGKDYKWTCKAPAGATLDFIDPCSVSGTDGCVPGYHYDSATKSCLPDASTSSAGKCLPGTTYDPATQCCSATPGSAGPYAPCPAGYFYWKEKNKCSNVAVVGVTLKPGDCTKKPPPGNPPPCNPNDPINFPNGCP